MLTHVYFQVQYISLVFVQTQGQLQGGSKVHQTKMSWLLKRKARVEPIKAVSNASSMTSLTPSQLDLAIRDMLSINPPRNRSEEYCRGNPITSSGKRKQLVKMTSIVMIPVVVLTGLTANTFFTTFTNYINSSQIRDILLYSVELGKVIHFLQEERDMSALYLSDLGRSRSKSLLLQRYPETDRALEKLPFWTTGPTLIRPEFQSKDKFLSYLNRHRYELDTLNQTVTQELEMYTSLIRVFITWLYSAITEAQSGFIWRSLVAYQEVIIAKEYMGLERALGTIFYMEGRFPSQDIYLWFSESQDVANETFLSARRYSDLVAALYNKNIEGNEMLLVVLGRMRAEIRRNDRGGIGSFKTAEFWFNNMTRYMDLLLETQRELAVEITQVLDERQASNLQKMVAISVVFVCVFILCPVIIYAVYSLTNEIQKYSITLADRTKALNKEKKRTDTLLYQMLPKSVADQLKQNEVVTAENFSEATIFFSDIQEFTQISARSSPIQPHLQTSQRTLRTPTDVAKNTSSVALNLDSPKSADFCTCWYFLCISIASNLDNVNQYKDGPRRIQGRQNEKKIRTVRNELEDRLEGVVLITM
ncbi:guanylate cyclase 32e [Plakobranchus ocellatus]|uniref:guanylate cyclase n=1 Tax=Plakobranchus ocellatus TaxID=259542 RepID=A0AAV3YMD0_9GAST|nr:guanylate cyclase 32e [Plakobranchus ocellatus]